MRSNGLCLIPIHTPHTQKKTSILFNFLLRIPRLVTENSSQMSKMPFWGCPRKVSTFGGGLSNLAEFNKTVTGVLFLPLPLAFERHFSTPVRNRTFAQLSKLIDDPRKNPFFSNSNWNFSNSLSTFQSSSAQIAKHFQQKNNEKPFFIISCFLLFLTPCEVNCF